MTKFKAWTAESIKFATTVLSFFILKAHLPDLSGLLPDAIVQVVVALVAGLLTMLVTDVILGRPVLQVSWVEGVTAISHIHPVRLRAGENTVVRCTVRLDGNTLVTRFVRTLCQRHPLQLRITLHPSGPAHYVKQWSSPSDSISIVENRLIFAFSEGVRHGLLEFVDFRLTPRHNPSVPAPVDCRVEIESPTKLRFAYRVLLRVQNNLDGFLVGR